HKVHVGPRDPRAVRGEDDRAVHLRKLGEPLWRELRVEQEPTRADVENRRTVADDDQRAHLRLQDAVDAFAQRSTRGNQAQRGEESSGSALRQQDPPGRGPLVRGYPESDAAAISASRTSDTRCNVIPRTSGVETGTIARRKPRRSASVRRRAAAGTCRTSPPRPTSPIATVSGASAASTRAPAIASATARSAAGSAMRTPPATLAYTS